MTKLEARRVLPAVVAEVQARLRLKRILRHNEGLRADRCRARHR